MPITYNGATLSDQHINKIVELGKKHNINPAYIIVQLYHETAWGTAAGATSSRVDNNWGGMTWLDASDKTPYTRDSGVYVTTGLARPSNEGGYYMHYKSVEDFLTDYTYLLRPNGSYKVSGASTLSDYSKGLFRVGGAKYDYAWDGIGSQSSYEKYDKALKRTYDGINAQNANILESLKTGKTVTGGNTSVASAQDVLNVFRGWLGGQMYGGVHSEILSIYNSQNPLPVGYRMTSDDDWCDATVTAAFKKAGLSHLVGGECGVQRHIAIFQAKGIWIGKSYPQAGDIITFDWDGGGFADHIGIVESVSGNTVNTIEGNSGSPSAVRRRSYAWNHWQIKGYARPQYSSTSASTTASSGSKSVAEVAQEVINGQWGSGEDRKNRLSASGYDYNAVQAKVNAILSGETVGSDEVKETGWIKNETGWWYRNEDGSWPKDQWLKLYDYWYLFDENGYAYAKQWVSRDGKWYYFDEACRMVVGWIKYKNKWYHLEDNGEMSSKEYVLGGDGRLYYVKEDGSMLENTEITVSEDGSLIEKVTGNIVGRF